MKAFFFVFTLCVCMAMSFTQCTRDCEPKSETCKEVPPTNELCMAAFQRWFFDANNNNCKQVSYSGCSAKGFATQQECEACKCK